MAPALCLSTTDLTIDLIPTFPPIPTCPPAAAPTRRPRTRTRRRPWRWRSSTSTQRWWRSWSRGAGVQPSHRSDPRLRSAIARDLRPKSDLGRAEESRPVAPAPLLLKRLNSVGGRAAAPLPVSQVAPSSNPPCCRASSSCCGQRAGGIRARCSLLLAFNFSCGGRGACIGVPVD